MAQDQSYDDIPTISTVNSVSSKPEPYLSDQIRRWELALMAGIEKSLQETAEFADKTGEQLYAAGKTAVGAVAGNQADKAKVAQAAAEVVQALENMPETAEKIYQAVTNPALYKALEMSLANQKEVLQAAYDRGDIESVGMIVGAGMTDFLGPGKGKKMLDVTDGIEINLGDEIVDALVDGAENQNNPTDVLELFETMEEQIKLVKAGDKTSAEGVKSIYDAAGIDSHEPAIRQLYEQKKINLPNDPNTIMLDAIEKNLGEAKPPSELDDRIRAMTKNIFNAEDDDAKERLFEQYAAELSAKRISNQVAEEATRIESFAGKVADKHIRDITNTLAGAEGSSIGDNGISTKKLALVASGLVATAIVATKDWRSDAEKNADLADSFAQAVAHGPEAFEELTSHHKELKNAAAYYQNIERHLKKDGTLDGKDIWVLQEVANNIKKKIQDPEQGPESFRLLVKKDQAALPDQSSVNDNAIKVITTTQDRESQR